MWTKTCINESVSMRFLLLLGETCRDKDYIQLEKFTGF
jgi:hypothetical protein